MTFAPRLSLVPNPHDGQPAIAALEAAGDGEFPDAVLTMARREELKEMAREFKAGLYPRERVYVASFLEDDAIQEWAIAGSQRA